MVIPENLLGILIWAALIYAIFRLLSDSLVAILRVVIAVFVAAEIIYFLRETIDLPFLDRISWQFIEDINQTIIHFFKNTFSQFV